GDPMNKRDPTGRYGRGDGFTDSQWRKFDRAQKAAAGKLERAAAKIEKALESGKGLKSLTAKFEKTFGKGSGSADNMAMVARAARDMAGVLRDGSKHIATGMSAEQYQASGGSSNGLAGVPST